MLNLCLFVFVTSIVSFRHNTAFLLKFYRVFPGNSFQVKGEGAEFSHSALLHYACRSQLTKNNGKNNTTAVRLCAVFVVCWW